jgi:hypothetical protein
MIGFSGASCYLDSNFFVLTKQKQFLPETLFPLCGCVTSPCTGATLPCTASWWPDLILPPCGGLTFVAAAFARNHTTAGIPGDCAQGVVWADLWDRCRRDKFKSGFIGTWRSHGGCGLVSRGLPQDSLASSACYFSECLVYNISIMIDVPFNSQQVKTPLISLPWPRSW